MLKSSELHKYTMGLFMEIFENLNLLNTKKLVSRQYLDFKGYKCSFSILIFDIKLGMSVPTKHKFVFHSYSYETSITSGY